MGVWNGGEGLHGMRTTEEVTIHSITLSDGDFSAYHVLTTMVNNQGYMDE